MRREESNMGSHFSGEPNLGSGSGSTRKGKKSGGGDKPKQPQRGLGVAQLEKIRMQNQMGCCYVPSLNGPFNVNLNQEGVPRELVSSLSSSSSSSSSSSYGFHPNIPMGMGDFEAADGRYHDFQSSATARWNPNSSMLQHQPSVTPSNATRHLLKPNDSVKKRRHDRRNSTGSSHQNSESEDIQELDLDLKLSL